MNKSIPDIEAKIEEVDALKRENYTFLNACLKVGISYNTYYRNKAKIIARGPVPENGKEQKTGSEETERAKMENSRVGGVKANGSKRRIVIPTKTPVQKIVEEKVGREAQKVVDHFDFAQIGIYRRWPQYQNPINIATVPSKDISGTLEDWIRDRYGGGNYEIHFMVAVDDKFKDISTKQMMIGGPMPITTPYEEFLMKGSPGSPKEEKPTNYYTQPTNEDAKNLLLLQDLQRKKEDLEAKLSKFQEDKLKEEMTALKNEIKESKVMSTAPVQVGPSQEVVSLMKQVEDLKEEAKQPKTDWGAIIGAVTTGIPLVMKAIYENKGPSKIEETVSSILPILVQKLSEKPEIKPTENPQNSLQTLEVLSSTIEKLFSMGYDIASKSSGGEPYDWKKDLFGAVRDIAKVVVDKGMPGASGGMTPQQLAQIVQLNSQPGGGGEEPGNGKVGQEEAEEHGPNVVDMLKKMQFAIANRRSPEEVGDLILTVAEWAYKNGMTEDADIARLFENPANSLDLILARIPELHSSDAAPYRDAIKEHVLSSLTRVVG